MTLNGLRTRIIPEVAAVPGAILYEGSFNYNLAAGETLEIKGGEGRSEGEVPVGKKWAVVVNLGITETDA